MVTLDNLFSQMEEGKIKQLNLIIKADVQGSISTGVDGPAFSTDIPLSFVIALILPIEEPTTIVSPTSSFPLCTSIVATGPLDLRRRIRRNNSAYWCL